MGSVQATDSVEDDSIFVLVWAGVTDDEAREKKAHILDN